MYTIYRLTCQFILRRQTVVRRKTSENKMLTAATRVFSSKGYASSSVSDIIKEAEVARGTFYLYFESKRAAFEKVARSP